MFLLEEIIFLLVALHFSTSKDLMLSMFLSRICVYKIIKKNIWKALPDLNSTCYLFLYRWAPELITPLWLLRLRVGWGESLFLPSGCEFFLNPAIIRQSISHLEKVGVYSIWNRYIFQSKVLFYCFISVDAIQFCSRSKQFCHFRYISLSSLFFVKKKPYGNSLERFVF